jgi:hypothetical protein
METLAKGARAPGRIWLVGALCAWSAAILGYWGVLAAHSLTPGREQPPPPLRPTHAWIQSAAGRHLLIMAVHPQCPCTRASAENLARLIAKFHDRLECIVLVYRPRAAGDEWSDTDLVASLRQQPNTRIVIDVDGLEALALGMSTSGAVALYSPDGRLRFWGGLTTERGHAGDSLGTDAITEILNGRQPDHISQSVYGCQLRSTEAGKGD